MDVRAELRGDQRLPVVALIPAYQPDHRLVDLVIQLTDSALAGVIVVNDGSTKQVSEAALAETKSRPRCHVVHHAVNLGKGRALKTGFNYFLLTFGELCGVVTADADGQHSPEDIIQLARHLTHRPDRFAIGTRYLSGKIPFRSYFGNRLTSFVFACLTGTYLQDTQSGLRGLPADVLPGLMRLDGERYEYEMSMLFHAAKSNHDIQEVPIETIYLNNNESSHFNPLVDSAKIYYKLLQFYGSSALGALLDLIVFAISMRFTGNMLFSFLIGRVIIAALVNFNINRKYVFQSHANPWRSLFRYYLLFAIFAFISYRAIGALSATGLSPVMAKAIVETSLSVLSFALQGAYVFTDRWMKVP